MLLAKTFVRAGILMLFFCVIAGAQEGTSPTVAPPPPAGDDSDPTKPVVWSLREEYSNLPGQAWNNAFILRLDRAVLKERPRPLGKDGILTRVDIPFVVARRADGTSAGLGNSYAVVQEMRGVPFGLKNAARLAAATAAPLLPLTLTIFSLEELVTRLINILF